jgi:hypothetical protein
MLFYAFFGTFPNSVLTPAIRLGSGVPVTFSPKVAVADVADFSYFPSLKTAKPLISLQW